jgi:hypothetical protein
VSSELGECHFANVDLSTADHLTANDIKTECGGRALSVDQVTQRIALAAGMSVLTGDFFAIAKLLVG